MYNKYNLILFTTIIFLIIIVINYLYNINYKKLEKFNSECGDENLFMDNQVQTFCSQICKYAGGGSTPEAKTAAQEKCRLNCPPIARNKLIKGRALGNDYLLKDFYKKSYNKKNEQKKSAENVLSSQVINNSRLTHILKKDCTKEQLDIIQNDMKKDKYGNWVKIGDSPTQYSYDDKVSILCSPDKNYVNTNIKPYFKNSEINDIIDQHSIIGLQWYDLGNKDDQQIINYISRPDFIEITNPNFIKALSNKIDANIPLKFTKTEINQLFNTNAIDISVKHHVIINDIVYFPLSPTNPRLPVWLYTVKDIAKFREKWYQKFNQEISKLDNIAPCTYNKNEISKLPNKISHNGIQWGKIGSSENEYSLISKYNNAITAKENAINNCKYTNEKLNSLPNKFTEDNVEWGKIGSLENEYSLISNLKQQENDAKGNCLIPGIVHQDISNLPNELTNPITNEIYGKYSVISPNNKYTTSYNYPYIDKNNLDNNLSDICFVSKDDMRNDKGELLWGKKQKYGGEYGLIGGWQDYLLDPNKETRYGKIKTSTNDGWVGKIGNNTGEYGKIGFTYDNPTGYRWVLFEPNAEQIKLNNPNIINNQELSAILNGENEYIITKNKFDSLNILSITKDSLISGAKSGTWYKPRDNIYINTNNCDSYSSELMSAVDDDILSNREQQTLDITMKYLSPDKTRFVPSVNCPSTCTKDSSNAGECAPCFRKGLIEVAANDWSKLVNSINTNISGLNTLIGKCENNLIYSENGSNKVKKLANDFKVLKFKVSKTIPVSGNNILNNNKDMDKTLMIQKITNNEDIDADTWNKLNINVIGPGDYVKHNSNYYVIDNETFFEIIKDYYNEYNQGYQSKKQSIPDCTVPYNYILKTNNTCLEENHQCISKNNIMTEKEYTAQIDKEIGETSDWYKQNYNDGHDYAKTKMGKYYPVPGVNKLGEKDQTCVPATYTQIAEPNIKYVRPNTCPPNQSCRLPCKDCKDDNLECKTSEYKYTEKEYNDKKESKKNAGFTLGKNTFMNTYDGIEQCVPSDYVPREENGKKRVKIGDTSSACTGDAQCNNLSQEKWNSILNKVKQENDANESECNKISNSQKTCLKECENNAACNLNTYNVNNVENALVEAKTQKYYDCVNKKVIITCPAGQEPDTSKCHHTKGTTICKACPNCGLNQYRLDTGPTLDSDGKYKYCGTCENCDNTCTGIQVMTGCNIDGTSICDNPIQCDSNQFREGRTKTTKGTCTPQTKCDSTKYLKGFEKATPTTDGKDGTCEIKSTIYSWGYSYRSTLGYSSSSVENNTTKPNPIKYFINNGITIKKVCTDYHHTLFLTNKGKVYAIGRNSDGELANGTTNSEYENPVLCSKLNDYEVLDIGTCYKSSYFLVNGKVFTCGATEHLAKYTEIEYLPNDPYNGTYNSNSKAYYNPVELKKLRGKKIIKMFCKSNHCMFLSSDNKLYAIGYNNFGQLGLGAGVGRTLNNSYGVVRTVEKVSFFNNINIKDVALGNKHTLVLTTDGDVYSFGKNDFGQLYRAADENFNDTPKKVASNISYINASYFRSMLLTTTKRVIYSVGYNSYGGLGIGNKEHKRSSQKIDFFDKNKINITKMASGKYHSLFLSEDGEIGRAHV